MSYFPSISQSVTADTANSYAGTIDNGVTWNSAGLGASTLGVNAIQVVVKSDRNLTIYVDQGRESNTFECTDTYIYLTTCQFGITIQAVAAYVRVRALNSSGAQATVTIDTVQCPIVEAVPRSLDENGFLQVALKGLKDGYGFVASNTPMGEMRAIQPTRLVGAQFDGVGNAGAVDPNFWVSTVANSGTVTQANAQVTLDTATTAANGAARLTSLRRARYVSANAMRYRAGISLSAAAANNTRRWGVGYGSAMPATITVTDGAWFQLAGTTFGVAYQKSNGSPTVVTTFNGTLGASYNPGTGYVTYEIYWTNGRVYWGVDGHVLHSVSASAATWSDTMNFHIFAETVNSSALQTSNTLSCRVASISRLGAMLTQPTSAFRSTTTAGAVLKYGPGNLHSLLVGSVADSGAVISIYDGLTSAGTVLAQLTIAYPVQNSYLPASYDLMGIPFSTGLCLVIANHNAAVTVIYE
jgi:hypothetical protein